MKNTEKPAKPGDGKQKKQLIMLGGLSAVFIAVLAIQFGGAQSEPEAAAMTAPEPAPASGAPEESADAAAPAATPLPVAKDNTVLAEPVPEAALTRSPFSNFWTTAPKAGVTVVAAVSAPTITLNATMPSESKGMAVIDGQLRFVGDSIQGWSLAEVSPRSVTLRAPAGETVVVDMPLLVGRLSLPQGLEVETEAEGAGIDGALDADAPSDG